jgi:transcriptional regulator with XRE-family HTH domain
LINQRRAFGDRLRRHRERQQVTLAQIAEKTKVTASLFAGLERGDCSRWPGGVYNRAFVRGYAVAVQLDPEEVIAEFVECYEPPAEAPARKIARRDDVTARPALRIGLAMDPTEPWRRARSTAALALADVLAITALSAAIVLGTGVPMWNALAVTAIAYHVLARLAGSIPHVYRLWFNDAVTPTYDALESDEEVPVNSTASTVA